MTAIALAPTETRKRCAEKIETPVKTFTQGSQYNIEPPNDVQFGLGTGFAKSLQVYIAASWLRRIEMRETAAMLAFTTGVDVTSRWLYEDVADTYINHHDRKEADADSDFIDSLSAKKDLFDVARSHVLVFQSEPLGLYTTGGRHVEFGAALAFKHDPTKPMQYVCVIGRKENVFHYLPSEDGVLFFEDWDKFAAWLSEANFFHRNDALKGGIK